MVRKYFSKSGFTPHRAKRCNALAFSTMTRDKLEPTMDIKSRNHPSAASVENEALDLVSGFTLIEMLVVVAVIGLLSSILLNALGPAKDKAKDARIMQEVNQVRDIAETLYNGTYTNLPSISAGTTQVNNANLQSLTSDIDLQGGELHVVLSSDVRTYVAYSKLNTMVPDPVTGTPTTQYYCVDSSGKAVFLTTQPNDNRISNSSPATCD